MILAIIIAWVTVSAVFVGSLAYLASTPMPSPDYETGVSEPVLEPELIQVKSERVETPSPALEQPEVVAA